MIVLALVALVALAFAEEGIICPKGITTFGADLRVHGADKYWFCSAPGERAILKTCTDGMVYNTRAGRCRSNLQQRLVKRADGSTGTAKNLELLELENMGTSSSLGALYNSREEAFIPGKFAWNRATIIADTVHQDKVYSNVDVYQDSDVSDRAYHLNVKASLKLGFLSGMISVEGAAEYLRNEKASSNIARVTMSYHSTRKSETMPISTPISYARICTEAAKENGPTHVVTSRVIGLRAFLVFDREATSTETVEEISGKLTVEINSIPGFKLKGSAWIDIHGKEAKTFDRLSVSYHGDAVISAPQSYASAITSFNEVQAAAPTSQVPVSYQLTPLSYLCDDTTAAMLEIGNKLVVRATEVLVELSQTQLDTAALLESGVADAIPTIKNVLNSFSTELVKYTNNIKLQIAAQLKNLRSGAGSEVELVSILGEYETSPFSHNKASLFLEVRQREISTIELVTLATKGQDIFIVSDTNSASDNEALLEHSYAVIYTVNVLPTSNAAEDYIASGEVPDESGYWYNDLTKVGVVGGSLKEFIKYGLANAPVNSQDKSHCFIIRVDTADPNLVNIKYMLEGAPNEMNFVPPPTPPTPVCSPQYHGFQITTSSTDNAFVTQHWVMAGLVDDEGGEAVVTLQGGMTDVLTIAGLEPNTAYNMSSKYKVFALDDAGFSTISEVVLCATAPSTLVQSVAVSAATTSSLTISWAQPSHVATSVASSMEYVVRVLKSGADEAESVIIRTQALSTTVQDLDSATLYHISVHTESSLSYSEAVATSYTTALDTIPFPEVVVVQETSVQLIEKLSLLALPVEMVPFALRVRTYQVDLDGVEISGTDRNDVYELAGSRGDKIFSIGGLVGGNSYGVTILLQTKFNGAIQTTASTDQLSLTTPFGGTEVEKVERQFDQIKEDTNSRASSIEGDVNDEASKLSGLSSQLEAYVREASSAIEQVAAITTANFTSQEAILNEVVKDACIEYGVEYYGGLIQSIGSVQSLQQCQSKCDENSACKGVSWKKSSLACSLYNTRRGTQLHISNDMMSINNVCHDSWTGSSAKWAECIKEQTNYNGGDISGAQSYGFATVYDCMGWCLQTATCQSVTYQPSNEHCWLKHRPYGDTIAAHGSLTSLSLACLQA